MFGEFRLFCFVYFSRELVQQRIVQQFSCAALSQSLDMNQREHLLFRTYKADRADWTGPVVTVHHANNNSRNNDTGINFGDRLSWDLFKNITFVETIRTTPDLQLWIFIVVSICLGIAFNLLVLRSIFRAKCNGTAS